MRSLKILLLFITLNLSKSNIMAQDTIKIVSIQPDSNNLTKGRLVNGIREGVWVYLVNNKIDKIVPYCNGKIKGKVIYFNSVGVITKELSFLDNQLNGNSYFYSEEGTPIAIIDYINDKKYKVILYKIDSQSPPKTHNYLPYNKVDFY